MKQDKGRPSLTKLFSYLFLSGQRDPLRNIHIDPPLPYGRRLSHEELEKQKRQHRQFLLLQTLRG
jgi:hypothetical protein